MGDGLQARFLDAGLEGGGGDGPAKHTIVGHKRVAVLNTGMRTVIVSMPDTCCAEGIL